MPRQSVRVVLASEYPGARNFLTQVIEQESAVEVVGEAQNAIKALTMARNLRPDVVVIDSYLPYSVGLDTIPLSRINGLDAAQAIYQEVPDTRVILLNNLDTVTLRDRNSTPDSAIRYAIESNGANISLAPSGRHQEEQWNVPVFASVGVKPQVAAEQRVTSISDRVIFFGALAFAGGWLLTLTMLLAPAGVPLALAGAATVLIGLAGKLTISLWRKIKRVK